MIRVGIVGTNFVSGWMADAIQASECASAAAIYSRAQETGDRFAAQHGIPAVYTDFEAFLHDETIDAVYIASPNSIHCGQAVAAMDAGKHVLCEKVIATNYKEFSRMKEAAQRNNVILMEAVRPVHDPARRLLLDNLERIGTVRRVTIEYCQYSSRYDKFKEGVILNAFNPEFSNAAIMDIGVYCIHFLVSLFGMPKTIQAQSTFLHNGMEGCGILLMNYGSMQAEAAYSKITESAFPSIIQGENGTLTVDKISMPRNVCFIGRDGKKEALAYHPQENNMIYELQDFCDLIKAGKWDHEYLQYSDMTMRIMDEARRQTGIVFPAEQKEKTERLYFSSDYMEGTHPAILKRLVETNMAKSEGYGCDSFSEAARQKIREATGCPEAEIYFLSGGTQTNATVLDGLLRPYQGVLAAQTGHIQTHEAGAIEWGGHRVMTLPHEYGKVSAQAVEAAVRSYQEDDNRDHMVQPGVVYLSQPTEYGTLYSLEELTAISRVCHENGLCLYVDGARLAYALACRENDVMLRDLAALCDVFYIGGTKCGALFGEAVVIPQKNRIPHFFTIIKQHGALFAKGRLLGLQFGTLFTDGLYQHIGQSAIEYADRIREALRENGYTLYFDTPTNQIFVVLENSCKERLEEQIAFGFWEKYDDTHTVLRIATSWATEKEDVDRLIQILERERPAGADC